MEVDYPIVNQEIPQNPQILNYAVLSKGADQSLKTSGGCLFVLLWALNLVLSVFFGALAAIPSAVVLLSLSGFGIYADRKDFRKSKGLFFLKAFVCLLPLAIFFFLANYQIQRQKYFKSQSNKTSLRILNDLLAYEIKNESARKPSNPRSVKTIIQDVLKKNNHPNDVWGRPLKVIYPGTHGQNIFDLYSAGPDGVYGNADDIGNW
jgi:hypothetical protein